RKLQVPTACEGAVVRCPACEATFPTSQQMESPLALASTNASAAGELECAPEGVVTLAQVPVWTEQAAWHRVHSGLGWVAVGLVIGFVVLFLQYLPALLHLSGIELAAFNDDEFWNHPKRMPDALHGSVGLALLLFSSCLLAGLFRCLMYPAPGYGSLLSVAAF